MKEFVLDMCHVLRTNCQCLAYSIVFMLCAIQPRALCPGSPQHRLGQPVCLPLGDWVILEPDEPGVAITSITYDIQCALQGPEEGAGAQRAIGCPGLDDEYGTIGGAGSPYEPRWPYRNLGNSDIFASFAMQCGLNEYAPEGRPMHEVS